MSPLDPTDRVREAARSRPDGPAKLAMLAIRPGLDHTAALGQVELIARLAAEEEGR